MITVDESLRFADQQYTKQSFAGILASEVLRLREENEHLRAAPPQQSPSPDCRTCANRGHTNGLSQETYCDGCMWYGAYWKKNHYSRYRSLRHDLHRHPDPI